MDEELYTKGMTMRRQVLGDAYVDKATAHVDDFNREFQRIVTEYCWGEVWTRQVLTNKQRSLNNLCIIATLNRAAEFEIHVRGAVRNGCTLEEIRDTLLQVADALRDRAIGRHGCRDSGLPRAGPTSIIRC